MTSLAGTGEGTVQRSEIARGCLFIDGEWRSSDCWEPNRNPSDLSDVIGEYAWASTAHVEEALAAARRAAERWSRTNPQFRSDVLRKAAAALYARAEELGTLLAREEGKIRKDGIGEVTRAAQIFHFYSGEPVRHAGRFLPSLRDDMNIIVDYEPLGVVSLITPWNFPMATPAWKIAAALAYGNCVVFKPSEVTPACAVALTEILMEAGLPPGVLNLVMGPGAELSDALIGGADGVSFTGASATGRKVLERAAKSMVKVQLELGGKSPLVVLDDADLDLAVQVAFEGVVPQTGQRCTASSRLIVTRGVHDAFVNALAKRVAAVRVGHALEASSEIGPVATAQQLQKDLDYVADAKQAGAELLCGGERLERPTNGYFFAPALFANTTNDMRLNQDEIFGPVAGVIEVADLDEAIEVVRDSAYALSSAICTKSLSAAEHFRRRSPAGMVVVNGPTSGAEYHVPFAGRGASGYGAPEQGAEAAQFFTNVKTTYMNYGAGSTK
jgi:acyl-CoA reductase-like NAD-dependent aldehyde dehydrogenase